MVRVFAISDIHGCYDQFIRMIKKIELTKEDKLIILGDQVDRGSQNMKTMLEIIGMKEDGYNIITLRGNHESMLLYAMNKYNNILELECSLDYPTLHSNGTVASMKEYFNLSNTNKGKIYKELKSQELFHIEEPFLFVHAGVFPNVSLVDQDTDDFIWIRDEFINNKHNLPYVVIFGHTPTAYLNKDKSNKIFHDTDKIGIDCACVFGGKLACLEVTTMTEYYV